MAELPPLQSVALAHGALAWREAGAGMPLVLLHGIGSGSGAWRGQFDALSEFYRVLAWDAPGYGTSDPLPQAQPTAVHYAQVVHAWLAALGVTQAMVVGHSLGAIVAAAWCAEERTSASLAVGNPRGIHVHGLVLASPAQGYASASADLRAHLHGQRIATLERLGVAGMADERSANLCAPQAPPEAVAAVRDTMKRVTPGGYRQACWMLAHDDLAAHLRDAPKPLGVLVGDMDAVTPPDRCADVAQRWGVPLLTLRGVGHACYVEDPAQFNAALLGLLRTVQTTGPQASHASRGRAANDERVRLG